MAELQVEKHGHVTVFTINRPESMNAINMAVRTSLADGLKEFNEDADQYVAIVTGAGDKAFSAGGDLKEMSGNVSAGRRLPMPAAPDQYGFNSAEKVTIAAVNGLAIGAGCELGACCDIRLASETAYFAITETRRGILPGIGVNVLPRLLPMGVVMDMILAGEKLTAEDALRYGFVQKVTSRANLLDAAMQKAEAICKASQAAVWGAKQILKLYRDQMLSEQFRYYQAVAHRVFLSGDLLEGPRAFAEKREPKFANRWPNPYSTQT